MTINILLYGTLKSIQKKKNMFPDIIRELESKNGILGNQKSGFSYKSNLNHLKKGN